MKNLLIILFTFILFSCNKSASSSTLLELHNKKQGELEDVCSKFINDTSIESICIASFLDSSKCESINNWIRCSSKKWECYDDSTKQTIYLSSKEEVLKRENISSEKYNFYLNFLKENNLWTIIRVYDCKECIDLESGLNGLRFDKDKTHKLKEDFEYQYVEQLNPSWYLYTRDWN